LLKDLQVGLHLGRFNASKTLSSAKGQLKGRATKVSQQNEWVVRIDQRMLWGAAKEIVRLVGQELLQWVGANEQQCQRRFISAPGAPGLLPGAGDGARVPRQESCIQSANVHAQLEGRRSHHGPDLALA
jgi:hypothetical protein